MLTFNSFILEKRATTKRQNLVNFKLLNRVLRSKIFLHKDGQLCAVHVILGFTPISNRFQKSKHVIKAWDSRLTLVDVAIEGFISKHTLKGTQTIKLPTFTDLELVELPAPVKPQFVIEEITSSDKGEDTESEDIILEEDTENPIRDEDFEVFYQSHASEEETLNP